MKLNPLALACAIGLALSAQAAMADINVGVSLSTTGPGAALGIPEKNALAIMPTEIAGEKINYIVLDDATDPTAASKNARKLTSEDKVDVLIGSSVTPTSLAVTEVAIETKTPQISLAPTNLPAEKNVWVFRTPQHNDVMASALAEHMKAKGVKTLGFIGFSDAYGEDWLTALKKPLEDAGIKLDPIERYNRTDTSVTGQILKLTSAKTDAVLVVGSGSPAALPQLGLIERGYKGQIYQTHAAASPAFMKVAQKAAENVIMPIGPVVVVDQIPDDHPSKKAGQELTKQYNEKPMATDCHFQAERSGVVGIPVPGTTLKLVPNAGKLEVRVKGPNVFPGYWKNPEATEKAFDEDGFYMIGDAMKYVDATKPELGLLFDGRVSEDFKLLTGTWVHVGALRVAGIDALKPIAQDIVVTGHDRSKVGFLVFPNLPECRRLCPDLPADAPVETVLAHPAIRECVNQGLRSMRVNGSGSSMFASSALLMAEPPSVEAGEITDKGYINQRLVLNRRAELVNALYAEQPDPQVIQLTV